MGSKVKARVTVSNARSGRDGVFMAKHLDGPDGKAAKMGGLLKTWHRDKDIKKSFEQVEAEYYEKNCQAGLDAQNERHRKGGHKQRCRTMDEYRTAKNTCPESTLFYLGDLEVYNALSEAAKKEHRKRLWSAVVEFWKWRRDTFPQVVSLDMALHIEDGAPHVHERHVWIAHDSDGNKVVNQEAALREMGVLPPDPAGKVTRFNNAKITYTDICREKMKEIARAHGIEVIDEPREAGQKGQSRAKFITQDEQRKAAEAQKEAEAARDDLKNLQAEIKTARETANKEFSDTYFAKTALEREIGDMTEFKHWKAARDAQEAARKQEAEEKAKAAAEAARKAQEAQEQARREQEARRAALAAQEAAKDARPKTPEERYQEARAAIFGGTDTQAVLEPPKRATVSPLEKLKKMAQGAAARETGQNGLDGPEF